MVLEFRCIEKNNRILQLEFGSKKFFSVLVSNSPLSFIYLSGKILLFFLVWGIYVKLWQHFRGSGSDDYY